MKALLATLVTTLLGFSAAGAEEEQIDLVVLTWNILHGADDQGVLNLEAKGRFLVAQAADLVFLQEVDQNCERSGGVDQIAVLGRITGMEPAFGVFMPYQGGLYGLGTLSALPVLDSWALELPEGDEPRVALLQTVEVLGRPFLIVNIHFNWTRDDTSRFAQASALLEELEGIDLPMMVAGDFNDVPKSRTMRAFVEAGFRYVDPAAPSFSARDPRIDIDHLMIRGGSGLRLEALSGGVLEADRLSDHRPVKGLLRVTRDR